jgi:cathepsin F
LASFAFSPSSAPTGSYSGEKDIVGEKIDATVTFSSATSLSLKISGPISVNCPSEAFTFSGSEVTLTNLGTAGDCVHDALAKEKDVKLSAIKYDSSKDEIEVTAKVGILPVTFTLSKSLYAQQETTVADHAAWFEAFKAAFGKSYATVEEHAYRFSVFRENLAVAAERNADGEARHGVTKFSDLSLEEFRASYLGYKPKASTFAPTSAEELALPSMVTNGTVTAIDWRQKSPAVLTPVKDQGQCGSCWAFSATEQIETDAAMNTGKLMSLSPQQITSCDKTDAGCNGGNTETAYAYVKKAGGLEPAADYPYKSGRTGKTGKCEADKAEEAVSITGYKHVSQTKHGEAKMVAQMQKSPISVCVDAEKWQTYTSGILGRSCGKQLDHCVQAVGLGHKMGKSYWIVRNSWNTDWGVDGYIYVQEGINACGIASDATVTTGAAIVKDVTPAAIEA